MLNPFKEHVFLARECAHEHLSLEFSIGRSMRDFFLVHCVFIIVGEYFLLGLLYVDALHLYIVYAIGGACA